MRALARRSAAVESTSATDRGSAVEHLRLLAICLGLTFAVFGQSAGNAATDTKFDLVISPLRFLGRALRLWDPIGNAGQLQNQAYGYLFPMGPFFAVLHAAGVAPWEIQRAWEAVIVVAAFLGTYLVARRLGVDSFWPAAGAGLVYALAPRTLGELTSISSELMPVAALPWVLLPLVGAAERGSPRRAAARSGVALLFAGGVNAAATLAILPVPALWLLTRSRGTRRRTLIGWWLVAVMLSCAWWLLPLFQLGRYSPPFLDWIEASSTTTLPTSLLATLRGLDHWESYLGPTVWPAGWILASARGAILATTAVAAAGLIGLARRDVAHRLFLWSSLILGLVLITAGHAASVGPPGADAVRSLLDGPLVPFRNVHKFDPLVRLPLSIGVGFVLLRVRVPRRLAIGRGRYGSLPARSIAALAVVAVGCIAIAPVFTNHLVSSQRITAEPSWWSSAAKWLKANSGGARALVVPGSASPHYLWGGTVDNALQPVATTPWTVRDSVPLTQPGYIRLLNTIEASLATGAADPTLAPLLARAGIGYVVIANDLNVLASQSTQLLYVRATLNNSPGITMRASIGPNLGGSLSPTVLLDAGATVPRPAVQIYGVAGWPGVAGLQSLTGAVVATGSADALPQLLDRGLSPSTPVLFGADAAGVPVTDRVATTTDGLRRREASFAGQLAPSLTMSASQPYTFDRPVHDYLPDHAGDLSAWRYSGIEDVTASSSGADLLAYVNRGPRNGPWSALDGDAQTAWRSSSFSGALGQWLQIDFAQPTNVSTVRLTLAASLGGVLPNQFVVRTDATTAFVAVKPTTQMQVLHLPATPTRHLRLMVSGLAGSASGSSVAIASLDIAGVNPGRTLEVPSPPAPDLLAFDAASGHRETCLQISGRAVCNSHYARDAEEDSAVDRTFALGTGAQYRAGATVRLVGGTELDDLLDAGASIRATASSTDSNDPRQRPGAAVDGDPDTSWQAAAGDATPQLTLHLATARTISGVTVVTPVAAPVAKPVWVTVTAGDQEWSGRLPDNEHIAFDHPARTDSVIVRIDEASLRPSTDTITLTTGYLPVGISEVKLDGVATQAPATTPLTVNCQAGLALIVDGERVPLRVTAERADVLAGRPVPAEQCADTYLAMDAGRHRVSLAAMAGIEPISITLARDGHTTLASAESPGTSVVQKWTATSRRVQVDTTSAALLVIHENANAGWHATLAGKHLRAVRVDGWQQAFVVPAGAHGVVTLTYAPQQRFLVGLVVGGVAALCVIGLALVGRRGSEHPPLRDGRAPKAVLVGLFAASLALLAGWPGVLVLAVLGLAALMVGRTSYLVPAWLCGGVLLVAGFAVVRAKSFLIFTEQNAALTQLLCVAALTTGVLASVTFPRQGRDP